MSTKALGALLVLAGAIASGCGAGSAASYEDAQARLAQERERGALSDNAQPSDIEPEHPAETSSASKIDGATRKEGRVRRAGPPPLDLPWEPEVDVSASVTPRCVAPGGTVRLEITTGPQAAVAYQAVYSDNRGGAQEPYGGGYGGNDKGTAGPDGTLTFTWVVSPSAPTGVGRVDVIVGWEGKWGYADPGFEVRGRC